MDLSIIVPTYNEHDNIRPLLAQVFRVLEDAEIDGEVIIVDDDSPDRTWELAMGLMDTYDGLQVVRRTGDKGLSTAVLAGFTAASSDRLLVMDADLSHPPMLIPKLYRALRDSDIAVASRYVEGGGVKDWPLSRRIISKGATLIAKMLTDVKDPMSGFFALRREVVDGVRLDPKGYKILLEILVRGRYDRARVTEVPFVFGDRQAGESKLSSGVCAKYISHTWSLLRDAPSTRAQLARFLMVGGLGTLVNLVVLWSLVEVGGMWYLQGAVLSFVAAVTSNFAGNKVFAFRDRRTGATAVASQYVRFFVISVASLLVNMVVLFALVDIGHLWYMLGQVVAIVAATAGNFVGNKYWTFGAPEAGPAARPRLRASALKAIVLGHGNGIKDRKGP